MLLGSESFYGGLRVLWFLSSRSKVQSKVGSRVGSRVESKVVSRVGSKVGFDVLKDWDYNEDNLLEYVLSLFEGIDGKRFGIIGWVLVDILFL